MSDAMPALALLIAKHKPKMAGKADDMSPPDMADDKGSPDIHEAIAKSLIDAIKSGDAMETAKCLKDFVELCDQPEGEAESKDEGY